MSYKVECISGKDAIASAELKQNWLGCLSRSNNLRVALQTPWAAYRSQFSKNFTVALTRNPAGDVVGILPLLEQDFALNFSIGKRTLFNVAVGGVTLMGNVPLTGETGTVAAAFMEWLDKESEFESLWIVGLQEIEEFSSFLGSLETSGNSPWLFYSPHAVSSYRMIRMPSSLDEYLHHFSSKALHELKRQANVLRKRGGGEVELTRITQADQVEDFLIDARAISGNSWQRVLVGEPLDDLVSRQKVLSEMADGGFLRSYILKCGLSACAYGIGFQLNETFYFYEMAYDQKWARFSPGKVMLYLMIQDLFAYIRPKTFYFGPGDAWYKQWFGTNTCEERTILVLRKSISNRVKIGAHSSFRSIIDWVKARRGETKRTS